MADSGVSAYRGLFATLDQRLSAPNATGQLDALKAEIESFLDCIRTGGVPVVTGEAGLMALETAMRITEQVNHSLAERKPR